jgi:hypothetical protein
MADKIRYLRRTDLGTECDACGRRLDLMTGGVCTSCERILCSAHLHGSWLMRMVHEFRREVRCVDCRAGRAPQRPAHALPRPRREGSSR